MPEHPCRCGNTNTHRYKSGWCCPQHTPAAVAGRNEPPTPDPQRTLLALRDKAGLPEFMPDIPDLEGGKRPKLVAASISMLEPATGPRCKECGDLLADPALMVRCKDNHGGRVHEANPYAQKP
jgi:hypothetical protein